MPHTITPERDGYRIDVTGALTVDGALAVLDDLDASGASTDHRYELVDLSAAEPLELTIDELHHIARRAVRSSRRTGVRLALVGPGHVVGTHTREYAHILGRWIMPPVWHVQEFDCIDAGRAWVDAA